MQTRVAGSVGPRVSALGLGCMGMSDLYGPADRAESLATIHAALEAGLTLLDTGDFYGMGHNEMLLRESLGAVHLRLSPDDLVRIEAVLPKGAAAGDRYPTPQMAQLDSERRLGPERT